MTSDRQGSPSKAMIWTGWVLSALPSLLLFMSGGMKLVKPEMLEQMGYPARLGLTLGIVEIGCTVLYLVPRTTVLGAILLTGYLGGAVATHARVLEMQFLVPLVLGVLVWGGLFLRDPRVRALIPVRQ
jgi:DoxX-like family